MRNLPVVVGAPKGCTCTVTVPGLYCPLHKAAPDLLKLAKQAEAIISQLDRPRVGKFWLPNYLAGVRYAIVEAEKGQVK